MTTKAKAIATANRFGFVLDETVSGKIGYSYAITFDHPTHSIGGDCRSVHVVDCLASNAWAEAIERMEAEGPLLTPCNDKECDYHNEFVDCA